MREGSVAAGPDQQFCSPSETHSSLDTMLLNKMRIFGSGRNIMSRIHAEPVTTIFQRNVGASCLSNHQAQRHLVPSTKSSYGTPSQIPQKLGLPGCHSRHFSTVLITDSLQIKKNYVFQQITQGIHSQSDILRTAGPLSLCKTCAADYHVTAIQRQVVNDEDTLGSREGWFQKHKMQLKSAPPAALVLGFSGLIPFIAPAAYSIITFSCGPQVAFAQVAYGACILSFLGGVRWGFAISPNETPTSLSLIVSVLPSLVAWTGLSMPIQPGLVCIISGLALAGIVDSRFKSFPPWFRSLRFLLTTFAILSVSVTFGFSVLYPPSEPEHGYNFKKLIKIAQIIVQD